MASLDPAIQGHLESGGVLLAPTRRDCVLLRARHAAAQRAAGRRVWTTPQILTPSGWVSARYLDACAVDSSLPRLLGDAQAELVWQQAVEVIGTGGTLSAADAARLARRAWRRLLEHRGRLSDIGTSGLSPEHERFLGWARDAEALLAQRRWLDPVQVTDRLPVGSVRGAIGVLAAAPLLPQFEALLRRLAASGVTVHRFAPRAVAGRVHHAAPRNPDDELVAQLAFAREVLLEQPGATVGLVIPSAAGRRAELERACAAVLQPALELPGHADAERCFDLPGGAPLVEQGIVADALTLLTGLVEPLEVTRWSQLLRSPAFALAGGPVPLAADLEMRRKAGTAVLDVAAVADCLRQCKPVDQGTSVLAIAQSLLASAQALQVPRDLPSGWAQRFGVALKRAGWPGTVERGSDEFQAIRALGEAYDELASLDLIAERWTPQQAVQALTRVLARPWQPERGLPSVVVHDALEPIAVELDALWVGGLTAAALPAPPSPEPLLPIDLQRKLGIGAATAAQCLAEAHRAMLQWQQAAALVVLSSPKQVDEATAQPSTLLPAVPAWSGAGAVQTRASQQALVGALERVQDGPVPVPAGTQPRGGTRILSLQAQCPFRAFVELRLGAEPLPEPPSGIDAMTRGSLLHEALDRFWQQTADSAGLRSLAGDARSARVAACVAAAIGKVVAPTVGQRARAVEAGWQQQAIERLLELEMQRPDFTVVAREAELESEFGGLTLRVRMDRCDQVGDGLVLIDYKTGRVSTSLWRGQRPDEPQLPLYALLRRERVRAIAFARATRAEAKFSGVGDEANLLPGQKPATGFAYDEEDHKGLSWTEVQDYWREALQALAQRFRAGHADVDPKPRACDYCHLSATCRVQPQRQLLAEVDTIPEEQGDD